MANQSLRDFYVYIHRRATDGAVFYVGKGSGDRAFWFHGRKLHWRNIAKKHGVIVEIVLDGLQEWYALELERDLIALHGRENLCNFTDGGEGISGLRHSKETLEKLSRAACGRRLSEDAKRKVSEALRDRPVSDETRLRISEAQRGRAVPEERRQRIANALMGRKRSLEAIEKHRAKVTGQTRTPEQRERMSLAIAGKKRRPLSPEHRAKLSAANKGRTAHNKGKKMSSRPLPLDIDEPTELPAAG